MLIPPTPCSFPSFSERETLEANEDVHEGSAGAQVNPSWLPGGCRVHVVSPATVSRDQDSAALPPFNASLREKLNHFWPHRRLKGSKG